MNHQTNMRLVETPSGQLLIEKCLDDKGDYAVKFSLIYDEGDFYVKPACTMSFKTKENQQMAFDTEDCTDLAKDLMEPVNEYLIDKE